MIQKILNKNFVINSLLVFLIFLFDRISKIYVIYLDKKFFGSEIYSSKFLNIELYWNTGIAFGLFSFSENYLYNLLTFVIVIVIMIIIFMIVISKDFKKYPLLMILGGALGNLVDRIFFKAVPDFIDFHIQNLHWFIFNVADIFISLGIIFMILLEIIANNKNNEKF
mgnify:FL=1|tara:strand:- start:329 stop:829 length:501 start_codon:yes stop_codon:yes gene_type:complete